MDKLRQGKPVGPTRGPKQVPTFKQNEHLLAGFEDGLVDEGISAGAPSLLGQTIAQENGWSAPKEETK